MSIVFSLTLILAGLLAASSLILTKAPDSKRLFDQLAPWSGLIGVVLLVVALLFVVKYGAFLGLVSVATLVIAFVLGFLLGFGLIAKWTGGKSPDAMAKAERVRAKLSTAQVPLGIAAVLLGLYSLV